MVEYLNTEDYELTDVGFGAIPIPHEVLNLPEAIRYNKEIFMDVVREFKMHRIANYSGLIYQLFLSYPDKDLESRINSNHDILTFEFIENINNFTYIIDKKEIRIHNPTKIDITVFMRDVTVAYLNKLLRKTKSLKLA